MLRSLLRAGAALAFAALIAPGVPSAAPGPGLAYDEIVRVIVNATPPPPGSFQADLAALPPGPASRRGRPPPGDPPPPGTAVATLTEATRPLGAQLIENQKATGYDTATTFAVRGSTGSCHDGGATIETVQYLPALARPTVNLCPLRRAPLPTTAGEAIAPAVVGGCRPTFTANRTGPTPPANRLALYSLVTFTRAGATPAPAAQGSGIGFLTERGNLKTLGQADLELFSVPPGYAKAP